MSQVFHTPRGEYLVTFTPIPNNKFVNVTLDIYERIELPNNNFRFERVLLLPLVAAINNTDKIISQNKPDKKDDKNPK